MISTAKANQLISYEFCGTPFVRATKYYIGLSTTEITIDTNGKGSGFTEPTNAGYARIEVPTTNTHWLVENKEAKNISQLAFPSFTSAPSGGGSAFAVAWFISEYSSAADPNDCAIYFDKFYVIDPVSGLEVLDPITGLPTPTTKPLVADSEIIIKPSGIRIRRLNKNEST